MCVHHGPLKTSTKIEQELRSPPYLKMSSSIDGGARQRVYCALTPKSKDPISARGKIPTLYNTWHHIILYWMPLMVESMFSLNRVRAGHALHLYQNNVPGVVPGSMFCNAEGPTGILTNYRSSSSYLLCSDWSNR